MEWRIIPIIFLISFAILLINNVSILIGIFKMNDP